MSILKKIKKIKQKEIIALKEKVSLNDRKEILRDLPETRDFETSILEKNNSSYTLITEIKKASPSKGIIRSDFNPIDIALSYERGGSSCISVLTDKEHFLGSNNYLKDVKNTVSLPVLRKDFIIDPLQVLESRKLGADCILIIIGMNSIEKNREIEGFALDLGLECILEVHSLDELNATKSFASNMIGINNRNLNTFETKIETTTNLLPEISPKKTVISESGFSNKYELQKLANQGVSSFLIGESLMRKVDIEIATKNLLGA